MQIKDIIKAAALMLNRKEIVNYIDGKVSEVTSEVVDKVESMVGLTNLVLNELSVSYVPMVKTKILMAENGEIEYSKIDEKVIKICSVRLPKGEQIDFELGTESLIVAYSNVEVEFNYLPPEYTLTDEIGYKEKDISARVIAYGVMAELAICEGKFDEAVTYHKRYVDSLSQICLPKNSTVKARRWA
jgi:hypothetical protein